MKKPLIFAAATWVWLMLLQVQLMAAPTPNMFAYGMKIDVPGGNAFYEIELPLEVYKAVTSKALYDIRIFNSGGKVVPHAISRPENRTQQKDTMQADLPFFPVNAPADVFGDEVVIHIEKDADGTIIDVNAGSGDGHNLPDQKVVSYLVDGGKLKGKPISGLELEWSDEQADFMGNIFVESSDNLINWHRIATGTVARLSFGNHRLDRKKIPLPQTTKAYLRLSWPEGQDFLNLTKVVALANTTYTVNKPDHRWTKALVTQIADKPGHYMIDTGGTLPADKVRILPKDRNSMSGVKLFSGPSGKGNGTEQWRGLVYNLDYQGTSLYNSTINVRGNGARYWLLTVDESETMPSTPPAIEFGWQPHRLIFLAQGNGPFQLAYGCTDAPHPDFKVNSLLSKYRKGSGAFTPGRVTPGPQYILAGAERLAPAPLSLPWRKYILWATLFGGVLAIGWMSVTLYRQLQAADKKSESD